MVSNELHRKIVAAKAILFRLECLANSQITLPEEFQVFVIDEWDRILGTAESTYCKDCRFIVLPTEATLSRGSLYRGEQVVSVECGNYIPVSGIGGRYTTRYEFPPENLADSIEEAKEAWMRNPGLKFDAEVGQANWMAHLRRKEAS